ncbi:MAG: chemotaxis protein CheW [Gammaproteobacteria bacterium]|nr:chemotaxis protein CheW [Gammaproteobacteria bacterium]
MAEARNESVESTTQWVTFRLGEEVYGIDVVRIREVLRLTDIAPVPGAADYVLGIINLRGNVVTVIDTRKRFGLPPVENTDSSRIVIVEVGNHVLGMLVDGVAEVIDVEASSIDTPPSLGGDDNSRYILGVASRQDELLILVDVRKLLGNEELKELNGQ